MSRHKIFNPEAWPAQDESREPYFGTVPLDPRRRANEVFAGIVTGICLIVGTIIAAAVIAAFLVLGGRAALARDPGGKYADSPLKPWFDQLASGRGPCCSFADGVSIEDVDWDTQCDAAGYGAKTRFEEYTLAAGKHCYYRVRLGGRWIIVPPDALVTVPNKFGPAVVWPYQDATGETQIRCFLPGAGT